MAKGSGDWSCSSTVDRQEWIAHLHDRDARNSRRSWISDRSIPSPGRDRFLCDRPDRHLCFALHLTQGRIFVVEIGYEPAESYGDRGLMHCSVQGGSPAGAPFVAGAEGYCDPMSPVSRGKT